MRSSSTWASKMKSAAQSSERGTLSHPCDSRPEAIHSRSGVGAGPLELLSPLVSLSDGSPDHRHGEPTETKHQEHTEQLCGVAEGIAFLHGSRHQGYRVGDRAQAIRRRTLGRGGPRPVRWARVSASSRWVGRVRRTQRPHSRARVHGRDWAHITNDRARRRGREPVPLRGEDGHEIVFLHAAEFEDPSVNDLEHLPRLDSVDATILWRPPDASGPMLVPEGIGSHLTT